MGRLLSNKPCELTLADGISGSDIKIFYRLPTSEERVQYQVAMVTRKGDQIESSVSETRMDFATKIMTGFADGAFEKENDEGCAVPISSDPSSPNYDGNWPAVIRQYASDILQYLAVIVFEASIVRSRDGGTAKNPLS